MKRFLFTLAALTLSLGGFGQKYLKEAMQSSLFEEEEILEIQVKMNIQAVTSDIEDRNDHYAELRYKEGDGLSEAIKLVITTRGKTRANPKVCTFPPLKLNFKKTKNYETLFSGQDKLKLVTHCQPKEYYDDYILQEYLTYKHYNILTDKSFKVRLLKVTYLDSASGIDPIERYGFLIEDENVMASRNDREIMDQEIPNQEFCETEDLNMMTVFQYMIGNTDWSVPRLHNMKLMKGEGDAKRPIPVPYDFDYSGAIATNYAQADATLEISTVRTRVFRGFCRPESDYTNVFKRFNEKREDIYALYSNFPLLDEKEKMSTLKYFDKFYKTLNHPKKSKNVFNRSCRIDHRHADW